MIATAAGHSRAAAAGALLSWCVALAACGGGDPTPPPPAVASVAIQPAAPSITGIGNTVQLSAVARDASGQTLAGRAAPAWQSLTTGVATVNATTGLVTAVSAGQATVIATVEGKVGTTTVTVQLPPPPPDVGVALLSGRVERGSTVSLRVTSDGADVLPGGFTLTANPAGAATFAGAGATLLQTGRVALIAQVGAERDSVVLQVAAPPTIVFDMVADNNRDIYTVALDGGDLVRLTTHGTEDRDPVAGNGRVVFVAFRDGNGELYSVPLAGGAEVRLTTTAANEADPALEPGGLAARTAFTSDAPGVSKLYTGDFNAHGAARATAALGFPGSVEAHPSWSPDGTQLVYMSTASGTAAVHRLTLATGADAMLTPAGQASVEPAWSADGRYVAYAAETGGDTELFLLDLTAGGPPTRLTTRPGLDAQPAWLADGRLVYAANVGGTMRLRWLDPASPAQVHDIDTGANTSASNPSGVN